MWTGNLARSLVDVLRRHEHKLLIGLVVVGVGFYLVNVVHYVDQPLRIEENEWPPMGRAVYEHGIPEIPAGEDHRVRLLPDFSVAREDYVGLWHPPLYMYAMGGFMAVAGPDATTSLRLIGALGMLACCALLFLLAREIAPRHAFRLGAISSFLLLIHPYAIQGSLFLDIDTSLYPTAFLLFLWLLARFERRGDMSWRSGLALGAAFALILWVKLTTVLVLVPLLTGFWIVRAGFLRGLVRSAVVLGSGAAIFLSTYGLYTWTTGQSFSYAFEFTFGRKSDRLIWLQDSTTQVEYTIHWHFSWLIPALLIVSALYGAFAVRRWLATRSVTVLDLLWAVGVAIVVLYALVSPNGTVYTGKYALPALPLIVFTAVALLLGWADRKPSGVDREEDSSETRAPGRGRDYALVLSLGLAGAVAVAAAVAMPDLLTDQRYILMHAREKLAVILGSAAVLWIAVRGFERRTLFPAGALVVLAIVFMAQSVRSYRADVSPLYPMTDTRDFIRSADLVNAALRPGEVALVSKDLGIRIEDNPVIEGEEIWLVRGDEFEAQALRRLDWITVVATNTFGPPLAGETLKALDACFTYRALGKAGIYERRPRCGRGRLQLAG